MLLSILSTALWGSIYRFIYEISIQINDLKPELAMSWNIHRICSKEEAVYVQRDGSSVIQKYSVPGAVNARITNSELEIEAKTGFFWYIDLLTGSRKRVLKSPDKEDS